MTKISLAPDKDLDEIVLFIRNYWAENHIFVRSRSYFEYEFNGHRQLQFLVAKDGDRIVGLLGFIQYRELIEDSDLFLVMFRTLQEYASEGLGIKLLAVCQSLTQRNVHTIGANPKAIPLYNFAGFQSGYLDHYYWLNTDIESYKIAEITSSCHWSKADHAKRLDPICGKLPQNCLEALTSNSVIAKSGQFFQRRYIHHPVYEYEVYGVFSDAGPAAKLVGVGVIRIVEHSGARAVRIVDWVGDDEYFPQFGNMAKVRCQETQAEFVDLYCLGISEKEIARAGFRSAESDDILPNYFSPLLKQNVKISFATTSRQPIRLLRGDGDQDRPS